MTPRPTPAESAKSELSSQKRKAVDTALSQIEKTFGKGAIMRMGEVERVAIEMIPTGSISLDLAIGGGVPRGRIVEIYGPESSGKTTLASHIVAEALALGGLAAYIDAEHAFDPEYARKIGVDVDNLLMSQPDTGEQALEITETLIRSNAVDVIVIDSVAALVPKAEIEGDMGDLQPGMQARLMSKALRKITAAVSKSKTCVIFINQLRMKNGIMFGNPETTTGGNALKFYASVRLDIRRADKIEEGTGVDRRTVGNRIRVKVVKNKIAPPFRLAEFDILYARGISKEGDILDLAAKLGMVNKSGAFYSLVTASGSEKIGQGREQARTYLAEHPEVMADLAKKIHEQAKAAAAALGPKSSVTAEPEAEDE
jgi:recombination protein RecA